MDTSNNNSGDKNYQHTAEYWEKMYNEFVEFRRTKPTGLPPARIKGEPNLLYSWAIEQQQYKLYLSPLQIIKLNAAKFIWASNEIDPVWEQWYIAFLEFRKNHPSGMPTQKINNKRSTLYYWCSRQRKRKDMLNADQLAKLEAARFEWETPMKLIEEAWENNFKKFVEFKAENPDIMPSPTMDGLLNPLYVWCNSQRNLRTKLGTNRVDRLIKAGFEFEKLESISPWELHYMEFITWRRKNPEGLPNKYIDGTPSILQSWCVNQRWKRKQKKLSREQIQKLDDAGFIWEIKDLDVAWEKKYREFVEFRKTSPSGIPPTRINGKANPLFSWYDLQRMLKYKLSPERISKLNAAGFDFNIYFKPDEAWEKHFADFLEFKKKNPLGMPPYSDDDNQKKILYNWCFRERRYKNMLSEDRKKRLDEAGFIWNIPTFDEKWEQKFREYVEFIKNNPGKNLTRSGSLQENIIYRWCSRQRMDKSKLSQEQIKKLDDVGFPWALRPSNKEEVWEKWFQQYLSDRSSFINGIPPRNKVNGKRNPIYSWYIKQCHDQHLLAPELIDKLTKAGFVWMTKNKSGKWEEMFRKYLDYQKIHPEGMPIHFFREKKDSLYCWCLKQRKNKSKLSAEQIKKLDEAGFNWISISLNELWEQRFKEYLAFREKNPKGTPQAFLHGKVNPLYNWCRTMQIYRSKLSPERIKKMNDAGFEWYAWSPNWMESYNEYIELKKQSFPEMIQDSVPGKKSIYKWIDEQRENKDLLPPEYIQKLEEVGFQWE